MKTKDSVILIEVGQIKGSVALINLTNNKNVSGKLSEIEDLNISEKLINKYNNILYVKDNNLTLDYIANFPKTPGYIANKNIIDTLKKSMEICYDNIKASNKLLNPYFDDLYIINLTELFGEGNEPSKAEMDDIFKDF